MYEVVELTFSIRFTIEFDLLKLHLIDHQIF